MAVRDRLYISNMTADYSPATFKGAWDDTASAVTRKLTFSPQAVAATVTVSETSATNNWDVLLGRWVSDGALRAGTAAGNISWVLGVAESNAALNAMAHVHVYVTVGDTDAVRGTLLADSIGATEWTTTATGRSEGTKAASSVAVQAGDRLVVEIGYQAQNTVTTSYNSVLHYGNTGTIDLSASNTSVTTRPGWIEITGAYGIWYDLVGDVVDGFDNQSIDLTLWSHNYGTVSETGGRAQVTCDTGYAAFGSRPKLGLQNSGMYATVPTLPAVSGAAEAYAAFLLSSSTAGTAAGFVINTVTNVLRMQSTVAYDDPTATEIAHSAGTHRFLRLREGTFAGGTSGTLYWDTSSDGVTWTNRKSVASPTWVHYVDSQILLESHRSSGATDFAEYDKLNTLATWLNQAVSGEVAQPLGRAKVRSIGVATVLETGLALLGGTPRPVASGSAVNSATLTATITGQDVVDGDVIVVAVGISATANTIVPPAGWTEFTNTDVDIASPAAQTRCYWRRRQAGDPAGYDWTHGGAGRSALAWVAYRDVDVAQASDDSEVDSRTSAANSFTSPTGTSTGRNRRVVAVHSARVWPVGGWSPTTTGAEERVDAVGADASTNMRVAISDRVAGSGSHSITATLTGDAEPAVVGVLVLRPQSGAGSTGPTTVPIGQAVETAVGQSLARSKTRAVGQATASEVGTTLTRQKIRAVSQATAAEVAQPVARTKTEALGQAVEAEVGLPLTGRKTEPIGQATAAETATALTRRKTRTTGQATESDVAIAVTGRKTETIEQAATTEVGQPVGHLRARTVGVAVEADTATTLGHTRSRTVGQAAEGDTATALQRAKWRAIGQATTTEVGHALARAKRRAVGQAVETDIGTVLGHSRIGHIGQASEGEQAQPVTSVAGTLIGQAVEQDTATSLARRKTRTVGLAAEQDVATPLGRRKTETIGLATEAETATAAVRRKTRILGQAVEGESGQPLGTQTIVAVGQADEVDTATAAGRRKTRIAGQAVESDAGLPAAATKTVRILQASTGEYATAVWWVKTRRIGQAVESDTALPVTQAGGGTPILPARYARAGAVRVYAKPGGTTTYARPGAAAVYARTGSNP